MSLRKSEAFLSDVETQFEWYVRNADWDIADRYLQAIEATCHLLAQHPLVGPGAGFSHLRLKHWRFMVVFRPFHKHILFYEVEGEDVILRRAVHGHRNFPENLA